MKLCQSMPSCLPPSQLQVRAAKEDEPLCSSQTTPTLQLGQDCSQSPDHLGIFGSLQLVVRAVIPLVQ